MKQGAIIKPGSQYGEWTIVREANKRSGKRYFVVRCSCGAISEVRLSSLTGGGSSACRDCAIREKGKRGSKHGLWQHPMHGVYHHMISRCYNPKNNSYSCYGAIGYKVCDRWLIGNPAYSGRDKTSGEGEKNFFTDMLPTWRPGMQLDKDLGCAKLSRREYSPETCKWLSPLENTKARRTTLWIKSNKRGKIPLRTVCDERGLDYDNVYQRIKSYGWSVQRAINEPKRGSYVQ